MKYVLAFLIILSFIGPVAEDHKSMGSVIKDGFYNYITCLDNSFNYLIEHNAFFKNMANWPYEIAQNKVMENRVLTKHLILPGENLDDIIKTYNSQIDDIEDFRKVVYIENKNTLSKDYQIKSGEYLLIPSEKLISKK